jgi:hypothetical protein
MPGVEVENGGGLGVEDKSDGPKTLLLLLPHLSGDIVTVAEIIAEALTLVVEENTTLTAKSYIKVS